MLNRSDIMREHQELLRALEKAHKSDIQKYCSGHLSPHRLKPPANYRHQYRQNKLMWAESEYVTEDQSKRKAKIESMTEGMCKLTMVKTSQPPNTQSPTDSPDNRARETYESDRRQRIILDATELFLVKPQDPQRKSHVFSEVVDQGRYWFTRSHLAGLTQRDQLKMMQRFERQIVKKQDLRAKNDLCMTAERYERKLEQELKKLPVHTGPSRARLAVFSDIFNEVCDSSSVFGNSLREIKTEYDLYVNSLLSSQSSLEDEPIITSLDGSSVTVKLNEARKQVLSLEQEARRALGENDRVRREYEDVLARVAENLDDRGSSVNCDPASLPGLELRDCEVSSIDDVQCKREEFRNVWEEVQNLEKKIKEKIHIETERCLTDTKAEIVQLRASNEYLKSKIKDLENNISVVLNRARVSEDMKIEVWKRIRNAVILCDDYGS